MAKTPKPAASSLDSAQSNFAEAIAARDALQSEVDEAIGRRDTAHKRVLKVQATYADADALVRQREQELAIIIRNLVDPPDPDLEQSPEETAEQPAGTGD